MGLHCGHTTRPGTVTFMQSGYWFKGTDDADYRWVPYREPRPQTRPIRRMYGFSVCGVFVGVMTFGKAD